MSYQRGRAIVHAAHGMVDIVESHAYHFQKVTFLAFF